MVSPGRNLRFRLWLAVILFVIGLALLLYASLPNTRIQQVQDIPPVILPTPTTASLFLILEEA